MGGHPRAGTDSDGKGAALTPLPTALIERGVGAAARAGRAAAGGAADAAGRMALAGLDTVLGWRYINEALERILDRLLVEGIAERLADRLVEGPELERVAARVIDSRLLDTVVERLLASEELWILVEEIAGSPAVTDAIGQQGAGFADQVAGQVRLHSQKADARLERAARRLLRRKAAPAPAPESKTG